jgi:predicted permease
MKELLWEVKYELTRTLKHIFYVLLVICWFAIWYAVAYLFTNDWNMANWHKDVITIYWSWSLTAGIGYLIYRITT